MKFLIDNNLPPALARSLNELCKGGSETAGVEVCALRDRFAQNCVDAIWLQTLVSEGGWNIISGDHFRKSTAEKELIRQAGLNVFVLQKSWAKFGYWPKCAQLIAWWPRIVDQVRQVSKSAVIVPWRLTGKFEQIRL